MELTLSRRRIPDLLHAHDGSTLGELCEHLDMTRQGVTQHLALLEGANLIATVRRGREKLHFMHCESKWTAGSSWMMVRANGSVCDSGEIIEADLPRKLVIRWQHQDSPELKAEGDSRCTMELDPTGPAV